MKYSKKNGRMKQYGIRAGSLLLCTVMVWTLSAGTVYAAAPHVEVDEAAYLNLDYYGVPENVSVVKSCMMNGLTEFDDYGTYTSVENMTTYDTPKMTGSGVHWSLKKPLDKRFYYSCNMDADQLVLPWTFDVSYKLNGVSKRAEELIGAEGLVQVDIHAIPNAAATEYFRNNMVLTIAMYVNMEDTLSLEAEGAQLQSLGTYKGALFMGVPGEELNCTVRIGSEDFECGGITMMMVPATLEQLDQIADLKDVKDTWKDSMDAIYDSVNSLCTTLEGMDSSLGTLNEGISGLENVHQNAAEKRGQMEQERDTSLNQLKTLAGTLDSMYASLENAEEITQNLLDDTSRLLKELGALRSDLRAVSNDFEDMNEDLEDLEDELDDAEDALEALEKALKAQKKDLSELLKAMQQMYATVKADSIQKAIDLGLSEQLQKIQVEFSKLPLEQLETLMKNASGNVNKVTSGVQDGLSSIKSTTKSLKTVVSSTASLCDSLDDLSASLANAASASTALGVTIGTYEEDMTSLVSSTKSFLNESTNTMNSLVQTLTTMNTVLKENGAPFDSSLSETAQGLIGTIDQLRSGLDSVGTIRTANTAVKQTLDKELDRLEGETNLLNLDPNANFVSLTSARNPEPTSVQVMIRTAELTHDSLDDEIEDLEPKPEKTGLWAKICAIFGSMKEK